MESQNEMKTSASKGIEIEKKGEAGPSQASNDDLSQESRAKGLETVASITSLTDSNMENNDPEKVSIGEEDIRDKDTESSDEVLLSVTDCKMNHASNVKLEENGATSDTPKLPEMMSYQIKWFTWKNKKTPIITQNINGPCPLIAISNVLILKSQIKLPLMMNQITAAQLMEYVGDCILENIPKNISESAQLNYEQNMQDAISILPKLQTGLDVNVKFTGVQDFEYTPECIVFDLLRIPLYHGWLVDPQTPEVQVAVSNCSYNQLVEKIINNKCSPRVELITEALLAENFLSRTASQLTYYGLAELSSHMGNEELGVLFRNNHFITLLKHKDELFQLVTDQGFLTEPNVVWETLSNIEGAGDFVDCNFVTVPPKTNSSIDVATQDQQQIDQDYLMALSLQEDTKEHSDWEEYKMKAGVPTKPSADDESSQRQQGRSTRGSHHPSTSSESVGSNSSKSNDCSIL